MYKNKSIILTLIIAILLIACGKNYSPEQKAYIAKVEKDREEKNLLLKNDPDSPFNKKGKIEFHNLKYFDVDPAYVFKSKLYEYNPKDTIVVYGTKGEIRYAVKFGCVLLNFAEKIVKVNVYQGSTTGGAIYYSIWFTDKTTNNESYGVGRYIDFEKVDNPEYIYTIDFNSSYNPYCAYSPNYSCAVPTIEDFIPVEIKAGEKKFHN
jgi:hypothetical protein